MSKIFSLDTLNMLFIYVIAFTVTLVCDYETTNAANLVSGKYLSAEGTTLVLSLSIQNPSPANLIVEQSLSQGNKVTTTTPQAKKIDNAKRKVKWLFRNTRSGKITLSTKLKAPLIGHPSAMVRYRDPRSGTFTELRISP